MVWPEEGATSQCAPADLGGVGGAHLSTSTRAFLRDKRRRHVVKASYSQSEGGCLGVEQQLTLSCLCVDSSQVVCEGYHHVVISQLFNDIFIDNSAIEGYTNEMKV